MPCLYRSFSELACDLGRLPHFKTPRRSVCHDCDWYEPPIRIINQCRLYLSTGEVCLRPKLDCVTCEHFAADGLNMMTEDPLTAAERQQRYYAANKEKVAERNRAWMEANKEKRREYMRDYMKKRRTKK